jgi:hypothetical protein
MKQAEQKAYKLNKNQGEKLDHLECCLTSVISTFSPNITTRRGTGILPKGKSENVDVTCVCTDQFVKIERSRHDTDSAMLNACLT